MTRRVRTGAAALLGTVLALAGMTGCGSGDEEPPRMPDVVGQQLDVALSDVGRVGVKEDDIEIVGGGVFGILDKSNWVVCEQLPDSGAEIAGQPRLTVDRSCDDGSRDITAEPTDEPSEESAAADPTEETGKEPGEEPSDPTTGEPITVESNTDFAALLALTDTCSDDIAAFAATYAGQTIAFDGTIVALDPHGDAKTRYDIIVYGGDFVDQNTALPGPTFQVRDKNLSYNLHWVGVQPDRIGIGTNLRVTAEVDQFLSQGCFLRITPVETSVR